MTDPTQLRIHNLSKKGGRRSGSLTVNTINKTTNRTYAEDVIRDIHQVTHYDTQRLTAAERARLLNNIDTLSADIDQNYETDRDYARERARNDRDWAVDIRSKINADTNARLNWAADELNDRLTAARDGYERLIGSSHNCYIDHMTGSITARALNQRAAVFAEMDKAAVMAETDARNAIMTEQYGRNVLGSNDQEHGHELNNWQVLKDALQTHDQVQHTDDDTDRDIVENISENTTATETRLAAEGWAEDVSDAAGAYAGKADEFWGGGVN